MDARFCDEHEWGFGWITEETIARTSHVLVADGGVWLVDPVSWNPALERLAALGEPRGVIQLLDRHDRDAAAFSDGLAVPHHRVPFGGVPGSPFELVPVVRNRFWQEVALWWPDRRVLVCGDAFGTLGYFVAKGERLGVHPLLRLFPPRRLAELEPEHVLVGHGEGVPDATGEVREAVATARRRLPSAWLGSLRRLRQN